MKCPKCKGEMDEGVLIDKAHYKVSKSQKWVAKVNLDNVNTESIDTKSYRCKNCGYLESYAK